LLSFISAEAQVTATTAAKAPATEAKGILKIILETDSSTKSVLVSTIQEDKAGDMSPVIGAANWTDKGKELRCRSLLEFDFTLLPVEIQNNPSLILQADLVLYPLSTEFAVNDQAKKSIVMIRQVLDQWEDSSTRWNHQPLTNPDNQHSLKIEANNRNSPARIDVTDMVLSNIVKEKNNGFIILYDEKPKKTVAAGQLFASPKHEDPALRPQLVLYVGYQNGMEFTSKNSAKTPIKPVDNLLNEHYLKRNNPNYKYDLNNPGKNMIYQMNLRTSVVPENPVKKVKQY
jgi:hypothetical protein